MFVGDVPDWIKRQVSDDPEIEAIRGNWVREHEADLVVCSGGMSVYEIAALGTPGIVLGQNLREDQRMREFARYGTVEYLGLGTEVGEEAIASAVRSLLDDVGRRTRMSQRGRALVDGLGATRTAEMIDRRHRARAGAGEKTTK